MKHTQGEISAFKMYVRKLERKWPLKRPNHRRKDIIRVCLKQIHAKLNWVHHAQNKIQWRTDGTWNVVLFMNGFCMHRLATLSYTFYGKGYISTKLAVLQKKHRLQWTNNFEFVFA
jgi:hypothetical protein